MRHVPGTLARVLLACAAISAAGPYDRDAGLAIADPRAARTGAVELSWQDPNLVAVLRKIGEVDGRVGVRLEVALRPGSERGSVWIGYPRYRALGTWKDAVHRLDTGRGRTIRLQRGHVDFGTFTVLVPDHARRLRVPLGRTVVDIDLAELPGPVTRQPTATIEVDDPFRGVPVETAPDRPARLAADLVWAGAKPFGDGALDAGESGAIHLEVRNEGERSVRGARIRVEHDRRPGVTLPQTIAVPELGPGERRKVEVPIDVDRNALDGTQTIVLHVEEPFGHDASPVGFELVVRAAPDPTLTLLDELVVDGAPVPVPRDRIATVRLRIRNVGEGTAERARATVRPGEGVYPAHGTQDTFELGRLEPGQVAELSYRCYANRRAEQLALDVELRDVESDRAIVTERLVLPLEDVPTIPRIVRVQPDPRRPVQLEPEPAPLVSDVDRFLPEAPVHRPSGLAVVLGAESYQTLPPASSAAADGRTAARYFERALGIPAERVEVLLDDDVTLAQMHRVFGPGGWLERRVEEDTDLFVFFAGHGTAALDRFVPYLLPVDADIDYVQQTGYSLDRLISRIASLDTRSATLFLDTCFSGLTREGGALVPEARPLIAVPSRSAAPGIAVFSASRGSQIASSLDTEGHGLFSYYLFRGLRGAADLDRDAAITAGELKSYLEHEVPRAALRLDRQQEPSILLDRPDLVLATHAGGSDPSTSTRSESGVP